MHLILARACTYWTSSTALCWKIPILAVMLSGCQPTADSATTPAQGTAKKIKVLATVGMVADLVKQIGGDHTSVRQLMGSGVDPHLYKARRAMICSRSCPVDIISGLMLEGRLQDSC